MAIKEGLIAYFGFLSAAVIQVIPLTASFIQSDQLNPTQTRLLNAALRRQQIYWLGLLAVTVFCLIIYVACSAIDKDAFKDNIGFVSPRGLISGFLVFSLAFLFSRMFGIFTGIMSLHSLRAKLVEDAADLRAAAKVDAHNTGGPAGVVVLPAGYGVAAGPQGIP